MEELNTEEKQKLKLWEKRMVGTFTTMMCGLIVICLLRTLLHEEIMQIISLGFVGVMVVGAVVLQFSEKCPRCGFRIGFASRLLLPPTCRKCGVGFK